MKISPIAIARAAHAAPKLSVAEAEAAIPAGHAEALAEGATACRACAAQRDADEARLVAEIGFAREYAGPEAADNASARVAAYSANWGVPDRDTTVRIARDAAEGGCIVG